MKIKCPNCGALYIYSDDFIKKKGGRVQCFKCKVFMQVDQDGSVTLESEVGEERKKKEKPYFVAKLSDKGKKRYEDYLKKSDFREYVPLAEELIELREYDAALEVCERLLSINPNSIAGKSVKLKILANVGRESEAESMVKELEGFEEGNPVVLRTLVEYYKDREPKNALKYLTLLELLEPDSEYVMKVREEIGSPEFEEKEQKQVVEAESAGEEEDMAMFWDEEGVEDAIQSDEVEREESSTGKQEEVEDLVSAEEPSEIEVEKFVEGEKEELAQEFEEGSFGEGVEEVPKTSEVEEGYEEGVEEQAEEMIEEKESEGESGEVHYEGEERPLEGTIEGLSEADEEEVIDEVEFEDVGRMENHHYQLEEEPTELVEEGVEKGDEVSEELIEEAEFEVPSEKVKSDEVDFSDVLEEVEQVEEAKTREEELLEEIFLDETELIGEKEISPELIEVKEKRKISPYVLISILVLLVLLIGGGAFYFLLYEYPGDVKRASAQKILRLSKGMFGLSVKQMLSKEAFEKGKSEFFKGNYQEALEKFKVSAFYSPKEPSVLSMYACLLTRERGAEFNLIQALLNRAKSLGGGIYYRMAEACVDIYSGEAREALKVLRELGDKGANNVVFYTLLFELTKKRKEGTSGYLKSMVEGSRLPASETALLYFKAASALEDLYPEDAKDYYVRAMELSDEPLIRLGYARFLFHKSKDYMSAQKIVEHLIGRKDISSETMGAAYKLMGEIEEFQGDRLSSADYFIKAFEEDNSQREVFFKGVALLIDMRKFEKVRKILSSNVDKLGTSADYYYFMGRCDYGQGRFTPAVENFKKAISIDKKAKYLVYLAKAYIKAGGFVFAEGIISELEGMNPDSADAKLLKAFMRVEKGEVVEALKSLKALYSELKDDPDFHYFLAYAHFREKNYKDAEKEGYVAWKMSSKAEYAVLLARVYFHTRRYDSAVKYASLGISKSPDTPEGYVIRAKSYEAMGNIKRALSDYDRALELSPENIDLLMEYAWILIRMEDYSNAESVLKEGLKVDPTDPRIYYALGKVYYDQGKLKEASSYFARAEELNPDMAEAYFYLGMIYFRESIYNKAYEYFYRAVQNEGNNPVYLYYLSKVLFINNRAFDALGYVEKAISYSPRYDDAWVLKGEIKFFLGKYDDAKKCFEEGVRLNSRNVKGWIQLAELAYMEGNVKKAISYISNAERYTKNNPETKVARGKLYYKQGEFSSALREFRKALKIAPDDPRPYYYMGLVYKRLGKREKAEEMFKKAVDLGLSGREKQELIREAGVWQ